MAVAPNLTLTDTNGTLLDSATVQISNPLDGSAETLSATTAGTHITQSYASGTLTLSGQDTLADYQQVLRTVMYLDTSLSANATTRTITFTASDGDGASPPVVQSIFFDVAPQVTGVYVSGANWTTNYLDLLNADGLGSSTVADQGFELASAADQLTTIVSWSNVNQISINFSEPVSLTQSSLTLYNSTNTAIAASGFSYNATDNTATWRFSTALTASEYLLNIAANSVADALGTALDGQWTTGVSTFASGSGDGSPSSDFNFYFYVLPGNVTNGSSVNNADVLEAKLQAGSLSSFSSYRVDVLGSGSINNADVLEEKLAAGTNLSEYATPGLPPESLSDTSGQDPVVVDNSLLQAEVAAPASTGEVTAAIVVTSPTVVSVSPNSSPVDPVGTTDISSPSDSASSSAAQVMSVVVASIPADSSASPPANVPATADTQATISPAPAIAAVPAASPSAVASRSSAATIDLFEPFDDHPNPRAASDTAIVVFTDAAWTPSSQPAVPATTTWPVSPAAPVITPKLAAKVREPHENLAFDSLRWKLPSVAEKTIIDRP